ncbi:hypothetical protein C3942_16880 [Solimonas fluminis]|uniref:Uncharacterized protein n=1 Tax=Solimonas fluminis TaxID=2086571 RepID=A0A2S5TCJ6_9GAMM|nr:hypothetical protein [Solimonas fluminis]PPE72723.1 hypothetical protein C3942_16880 [Solimonas fluminis]
MGAFGSIYGGSGSFDFSLPPLAESTGLPVGTPQNPGTQPSWLQSVGGLLDKLGGTAAQLAQAGVFGGGKPDLSRDYAADQAARERDGQGAGSSYSVAVPRQVQIPSWLIFGGLALAGFAAYKLAK